MVATPPQLESLFYSPSVLAIMGIDIYVPDGSVQAYKKADIWKLCNIYPLSELPQSIENTSIYHHSQKHLCEGQIFIQRGDKTYTITGAEVK